MHPGTRQQMSKKLPLKYLGAACATCFLFSLLVLFIVPAMAQSNSPAKNATPGSQAQEPATTIASAVDREIGNAEKQIVEVAEAMPEDKFNFSPESLNISGSDYKGVRTFALEVRHIAASNYAIWSPLTGDKFPKDFMGGNGPENLKTKAEIIQFLKVSFALGHKAVATLTIENMSQPAGGSKSSRLRLAEFAVSHAYDHYGQMVEYLRMNGIVPPASRQKSD
jgi:DinB superfamily